MEGEGKSLADNFGQPTPHLGRIPLATPAFQQKKAVPGLHCPLVASLPSVLRVSLQSLQISLHVLGHHGIEAILAFVDGKYLLVDVAELTLGLFEDVD